MGRTPVGTERLHHVAVGLTTSEKAAIDTARKNEPVATYLRPILIQALKDKGVI